MNDDEDLFKQEMKGVTPIKVEKKVVSTKNEVDPKVSQARREAATKKLETDSNHLTTEHVERVGPHDIIEYKRPGIQNEVFRKLRLGKYQVEARLDLHHKTVEQARVAVFQFIKDCIQYELRTVIIVHGKSDRKGKEDFPAQIKSFVAKWLPEIDQVMAFHSAQKQHGGTGAVYVMLRKSDRQRQDNRERFSSKG